MKRAIVIVAVIAAALGAVAIRVVLEGRAALERGDDWLARGSASSPEPVEINAIRAYETAARWYLPLAPHVDEAYAKLRALAAGSDAEVALAAWRAIRGAARATRTLWTPHADDLAAADAAIATLSAGAPGAATSDPAWHRAQLARDGRPSIAAASIAGLGILLWLSGAVLLVRRGITAQGRVLRRPALAAAAATVLGVVCWAVGLYNA